jgi:hypothetical protein
MTDLRIPYGGASIEDRSRHTPKRASLLKYFMESLHHSRRLQAAVVIRQYRHLISPDCGY